MSSDSSEDSVRFLPSTTFDTIAIRVQEECHQRRLRMRQIREEEREMERKGIQRQRRPPPIWDDVAPAREASLTGFLAHFPSPTNNTLVSQTEELSNVDATRNVSNCHLSSDHNDFSIPLTNGQAQPPTREGESIAFPDALTPTNNNDNADTKSTGSMKRTTLTDRISNTISAIGKTTSHAVFKSAANMEAVNDLNQMVCPIPPALLEREWEEPLQPESGLVINETFLVIISFLAEEKDILMAVSLVCRAWRERTNYLPQWHNLTVNALRKNTSRYEVGRWSSELTRILKNKLKDRYNVERQHRITQREALSGEDVADHKGDDTLNCPQPLETESTDIALAHEQISAVINFGITTTPAVPRPETEADDLNSSDTNNASLNECPQPVKYPEHGTMYLTRDDFIEQCHMITEIRKEHEGIQGNYLPSCDRFCDGVWATGFMVITIGVTFTSAFFAGYNHNGLDTDVKFGTMYYFTFSMVWALMLSCFLATFDSKKTGNAGLVIWSFISVIVLGMIVGLIGMRLATISYLETKPMFYASRCPAYETDDIGSDMLGPDIPPQLVVIEGFEGWQWSSQQRLVVDVPVPNGVDPNATAQFYVMLMNWTAAPDATTNTTVCPGTSLPRQVAFMAQNNSILEDRSNFSFSTLDLPFNPLVVFRNTKMEFRVPMNLKYDDPFDYPDVIMWIYDAWYSNSPMWINDRVPLLPLFGAGTITSENPNALRTPTQIRWAYSKGLIGLGSTCFFLCILVGLGFGFPRKSCRGTLRIIALIAYAIILNPITMAIWGATCYFGKYESCLMSNNSALALFISGISITIVGIISTVLLVNTSD